MCETCGRDDIIFVWSNKKIKRAMIACNNCGSYISWVSNDDWDKIKEEVTLYTEEYRQNIRGNYYG